MSQAEQINIDMLNLRELGELEMRIKLRKEKVEEEENESFLKMMKGEALKRGVNLEQLLGGKIKKPRKKVAPKYQNPDFDPASDPQKDSSWTGVGKKPKWVQKYLEKHDDLDDIFIDNKA